MNKLITTLFAVSLTFGGVSVIFVADVMGKDAMSKGAMSKDAMSKDAMLKDAMSKDAMLKDAMLKDAMSKDATSKDAMSKDVTKKSSMKKDMMKKDAMKKDAMKKDAMLQQGSLDAPPTRDKESRTMTLFIVSFLGGMLTVLAPCILPIVPFVFARVDQPFVKSELPMLVGMVSTFAAVGMLGAVAGS